MKFQIETAEFYYNKKEKQWLETLGFSFKSVDGFMGNYTSTGKRVYIRLETLEDLMKLIAGIKKNLNCDKGVIINKNKIIIYDYYVE